MAFSSFVVPMGNGVRDSRRDEEAILYTEVLLRPALKNDARS